MKLRKDTERIQHLLGQYVRDGIDRAIPGVTPGRVKHYRRLVYNVVKDTMDTAFPIARSALGSGEWDRMVYNFFSQEELQVPQVWKLPLEFYRYHTARDTGTSIGKPYLSDLLYFEWIEIEVHTMPDRPYPQVKTDGDFLKDVLAFNPEHEIIRLKFPVHLHPAESSIPLKGDYYVMVYRMPGSGNVKFLDLTELHVYMILKMVEDRIPVASITGEIAMAAGIESETYLEQVLEQFIRELMEKKLVLGFLKNQ
jgi:hypothetical protein